MMNWLSLAFRSSRRPLQEADRAQLDMSEDILRLSGAANLALATGILRTLLDKQYIDRTEASALCRFVADTLVDVQVPYELSSAQAGLWQELSKTFERQQAYL